MNTRAVLIERLLDLAWSQWTTLGVAGVRPASKAAIDLESLMLLTAELAENDPRLRDEALDWCAKFHRFSSKPRLKQLLRAHTTAGRAAFGPFASALQEHAGSTWPGATRGAPWQLRLSGKSRAPDLGQPPLINLRLRALFGISARADVITALLPRPAAVFGAASLVYVGYTKRNLADALESLTGGGLFRAARVGNRVQFSWLRHRELSLLVKPLPQAMPSWPAIIRIASAFLGLLTRVEGKSERICLVEAAQTLRQLGDDMATLGLAPPKIVVGVTTWQVTESWLLAAAQQLTEGTAAVRSRSASE